MWRYALLMVLTALLGIYSTARAADTDITALVVAPEKPDRAWSLGLVHGCAGVKPDASRLRAARGWRGFPARSGTNA
jgi:hypothetical protein